MFGVKLGTHSHCRDSELLRQLPVDERTGPHVPSGNLLHAGAREGLPGGGHSHRRPDPSLRGGRGRCSTFLDWAGGGVFSVSWFEIFYFIRVDSVQKGVQNPIPRNRTSAPSRSIFFGGRDFFKSKFSLFYASLGDLKLALVLAS